MISTVERVLFLKSIDIFADISGELLVSVAKLAEEEEFGRGDTVLRQGAVGDALYLVVDGAVAVIIDGREIANLGDGECIGEMSLLDSEPRSASVVATKPTLCLRLDQAPFFDLLAEHPPLSQGLIAVLTRRLRTMLAGPAKYPSARPSLL